MTEENKNNEEATTPKRRTRLQRFKEKLGGSVKFSFIFFIAIHIAAVVIASVYYKECPTEPGIPKFLMALGLLGIISKVVTLFKDCIIKYTKISPILSFILTLELAVFIVASYYVYREYKPNYNPLFVDQYCNKTLYLFSFIYITIVYCIILLLVLIIGCFVVGIMLIDKCGSKDLQQNV